MLKATIGDFGRGLAHWYIGGNGQDRLNFLAANGFPVGSYQSFLAPFTEDYFVTALDSRGAWPDSKSAKGYSWGNHRDDLISFLENANQKSSKNTSFVGAGHSLGGAITLLAALKRPELFSKIILIDPATLPNRWGAFVYRTKVKLPHKKSLARKTLNRRTVWDSRQQFIDYLGCKAIYKKFVPQARIDYANEGLVEQPDGKFHFRYKTQWEAQNFKTAQSIWHLLDKVELPVLLLLAENSDLYQSSHAAPYIDKLSEKVDFEVIKRVGHLAPQEDPQQVAGLMRDWLRR